VTKHFLHNTHGSVAQSSRRHTRRRLLNQWNGLPHISQCDVSWRMLRMAPLSNTPRSSPPGVAVRPRRMDMATGNQSRVVPPCPHNVFRVRWWAATPVILWAGFNPLPHQHGGDEWPVWTLNQPAAGLSTSVLAPVRTDRRQPHAPTTHCT